MGSETKIASVKIQKTLYDFEMDDSWASSSTVAKVESGSHTREECA